MEQLHRSLNDSFINLIYSQNVNLDFLPMTKAAKVAKQVKNMQYKITTINLSPSGPHMSTSESTHILRLQIEYLTIGQAAGS